MGHGHNRSRPQTMRMQSVCTRFRIGLTVAREPDTELPRETFNGGVTPGSFAPGKEAWAPVLVF